MPSGATDDPFTASSAHDIPMISVGQRERNIEGGKEGGRKDGGRFDGGDKSRAE